MQLSRLFVKTYKENPDETYVNAILLQKAGLIDKLIAGVYTYLPFGLKVLRKIENIIRKGMNEIGGIEIYMPALTPSSLRKQTGRRDSIDVLYKLDNTYAGDLALGSTHEEIITPLIKKHVRSYRDLPIYVYQIQNKFRNEKRAKSGILRSREFLMKDLYSFHVDVEDLDNYYEIVKQKYLEIYEKLGLKAYVVDASGGSFSEKPSHEFQVITPAGEDIIWYNDEIAVNEEDALSLGFDVIIENGEIKEVKYNGKVLNKAKASEVGNIFKLYDRFSKSFDFKFVDRDGSEKYVQMGCYGIGVSRLMGVIVECYHDQNGIIWPLNIAPYTAVIIPIGLKEKAFEIYKYFSNIYPDEIVIDDRDESIGYKLKDADLIGYPYKIIISENTLKLGDDVVEIIKRSTGEKIYKSYKDINFFDL